MLLLREYPMQIFVQMHPNRTKIGLDVTCATTISDIKSEIWEKESIPTAQQRLIFAGRYLDDERPLGFYSIQNKSTLQLAQTAKYARESFQISVRLMTGK